MGLLRHKGVHLGSVENVFGEYRREYAAAIANGHTSPAGNNPKIQRGEMEKQEQVQPRLENYSAVKEKRRMHVTMPENFRTAVRKASQVQKGTHHTHPFSVWGTGCDTVVQRGLECTSHNSSPASASFLLELLPGTPYLATNPLIPTLGTHEVDPQCQRQLGS